MSAAAPGERFLLELERELRGLKPGAQRAAGGGVYMRLDGAGRRRFQFRSRAAGGQAGRTFDSWQEAREARNLLETAAGEEAADGEPTAAQLRTWTIERYGREAWWPTVELECDALTLVDYRRGFRDLLPHVKGVTMGQLAASPLLIDRIRQGVRKAKTYPDRPGERPRLHRAAADKPLKILSNIGSHAVEHDVLARNPAAGIKRFNRRRSAAGDPEAPGHRPILATEVVSARTLVLAGAGMRGNPLQLEQRRLIPELIATRMRPSDIMAMRHRLQRRYPRPWRRR